jgi:tRNA threonylcarbamoyladenosine modification (KEOPS) complex  Pcc1 subunit
MGGTKKRGYAEAEIKIWLSQRVMRAVYQSLLPETKLPEAKVELDKNRALIMRIKGEDLSTLRAALNSFLRWTNVAMEVVKNG